jgi:hypothetical protein
VLPLQPFVLLLLDRVRPRPALSSLSYCNLRMRNVSIPAATIRRGNTTAKYRRKACSMWDLMRVLSLPRIRRTTVTHYLRPTKEKVE